MEERRSAKEKARSFSVSSPMSKDLSARPKIILLIFQVISLFLLHLILALLPTPAGLCSLCGLWYSTLVTCSQPTQQRKQQQQQQQRSRGGVGEAMQVQQRAAGSWRPQLNSQLYLIEAGGRLPQRTPPFNSRASSYRQISAPTPAAFPRDDEEDWRRQCTVDGFAT